MEEAPAFVKWLVDKYDDLEFFMGKSMNPDAGLVYSYYKDGAMAPTFVYIKAGYKVSKVGACPRAWREGGKEGRRGAGRGPG